MALEHLIKALKKRVHPNILKYKLLHYALKGGNVECPCCGSKYLTFLPAGIEKRANARCIKCGSLERHRTVWLFLKEQGDLFTKPLKLLHVAPEKLYYQRFTSLKNIDYYPVDLQPDSYNYGNKTVAMDITNIEYEDSFFDVIICSHVLEHVPDDKKAMREMYRVLKQGSWAIINVPVKTYLDTTVEDPLINDPKKQLELFGQPDHVRIYGTDYVERLRQSGFTVEEIDYVNKFNHNQQFKYGMKQDETIFFCKKY